MVKPNPLMQFVFQTLTLWPYVCIDFIFSVFLLYPTRLPNPLNVSTALSLTSLLKEGLLPPSFYLLSPT